MIKTKGYRYINNIKVTDKEMEYYHKQLCDNISYRDLDREFGLGDNGFKKHMKKYCSKYGKDMPTKQQEGISVSCGYCGRLMKREYNQYMKSGSKLFFCSKECGANAKRYKAEFDKDNNCFIYYDDMGNQIMSEPRNYGYSGKFEYNINVGDIYKHRYYNRYRQVVEISDDGLNIARQDLYEDNFNIIKTFCNWCERKTFVNKCDMTRVYKENDFMGIFKK